MKPAAQDEIPILGLVVHVKKNEALILALSALWIFSALTAYYIVKPIRSTVLQQLIGVDNKWIALLATTVFVGFFAYGYGKIVPKVPRGILLTGTFLMFIGTFALFAAILPSGRADTLPERLIGYAFYIWVSTFNLMVVSQFWGFAADMFNKEQGARLFGAIGVGGVLGGIFGTVVVSQYAKKIATWQMLALSAGTLGLCLLLSFVVRRLADKQLADTKESKDGKESKDEKAKGKDEVEKKSKSAPMLVFGSPYLRLVALMMLLLNIINTSNEWVLDKTLSTEGLDDAGLNEWYGLYYLTQNIITFGIQLFLTGRIQRMFGARGALFVEPTIGIAGAIAFIFAPFLSVIRWHKIMENAADYSIQTNTRELLYVPTSKVEKYSAKNFNDTFVVRAGDAVAAGIIALATSWLLPSFGPIGLKILLGANIAFGAVWLVTAARIGKMHKEKMEEKGEDIEAAIEKGH